MDPDSQKIYEEVRERICLFEYSPGEMISENALATEFGVSRSRMRHVMWQLENDGLIHISKGSGAVITAVDIKSLKEVYVVRQKLIELVAELRKLYYAFHLEMLNTIRNTFLKEITDKLYHRTARVWLQLLPDLDWNQEVDVMCDEIDNVIGALRHEDMATVAQVRRQHMAMLLRRINDYLGDVHVV